MQLYIRSKSFKKVLITTEKGKYIFKNYLKQFGSGKIDKSKKENNGIYNPPIKFVLGDIHEDYDALISALKSAKLISDNGIAGGRQNIK